MNSDMNPMDEERLVVQEEHKHEERVLKEVSKRNDYFLGICIVVAAVLISGSVVYTLGKKSGGDANDTTLPVADVKVPEIAKNDVILGNVKAPVTLIEFADYQCPFCAKFHTESGTQIREKYIKTGKAKMVYRDFAFLGPESLSAASATRCAADQAKFWEYHDAIFETEIKDGAENNGNLNRDLFVKLASGLSMNIAQFTACVDGKKYDAQVTGARQDAGLYGVNSTPMTFVNGELIQGAQPFATFEAAIEAALKK